MRKGIFAIAIAAGILSAGCQKNAITGRNQLSLVSESTVQNMAVQEYAQFLSTAKVVSSSANKDAEMVKRVGNRIANAITQYYKQKGEGSLLNGYKWEFNLVQDDQVNAWCMPGGKVVVYTGLLPVTRDEASLAIVMGHEITHAVAGHGREQMSQQLLAQGLQTLGSAALSRNGQAQSIFNTVFAPGAQVGVLLPNSRNAEYEADHYGLIFAAMAGYNPQVAVSFWQRMAALSANSSKPPVILSTHPADQDRIARLQELMPEAMKYYKPVR